MQICPNTNWRRARIQLSATRPWSAASAEDKFKNRKFSSLSIFFNKSGSVNLDNNKIINLFLSTKSLPPNNFHKHSLPKIFHSKKIPPKIVNNLFSTLISKTKKEPFPSIWSCCEPYQNTKKWRLVSFCEKFKSG